EEPESRHRRTGRLGGSPVPFGRRPDERVDVCGRLGDDGAGGAGRLDAEPDVDRVEGGVVEDATVEADLARAAAIDVVGDREVVGRIRAHGEEDREAGGLADHPPTFHWVSIY